MSSSKVTVNRRAKAIANEWARRNRAGWNAGVPDSLIGIEFTIQGLRFLPNGKVQLDCRPGEETILIGQRELK